jgi:Tfp pilus assembly protein PilX
MTAHPCIDRGQAPITTSSGDRLAGERGSGLVAGIVLIFAFTFLGMVWLARDVDRGVSNRSAAQSIAFQAARSGAQSASIGDLRSNAGAAAIDEQAARRAATATADALFASYGVDGSITSIDVVGDRVTVTVVITDGGVTVTGAGTVRAERAP